MLGVPAWIKGMVISRTEWVYLYIYQQGEGGTT